MKKYLLFSILTALFMAITPAQAGIHYSEASVTTLSSSIFTGDTVSIPWREGFESITATDIMPYGMSMSMRQDGAANPVHTYPNTQTTADAEVTTYGNTRDRKARNGNKFAEFVRFTASSNVVNSWIFSRGIFLRAGSSYTFSFWYANSAQVNGWILEAMAGTSPSAEGMMVKIGDSISSGFETQYKNYAGTFTPEKDGIYYFGIHAIQVARTAAAPGIINAMYRNTYLAIDDLEVNFGSTPCTDINIFARNLTHNTAELYRVYTPNSTSNFTLNYKKTTDVDWTSQTLPANQLSVTLYGLTAKTSYQAILSYLCAGNTFLSDTISLVTLPAPPAPLNPADYSGKFPIVENFDGVTKSGNNTYIGNSGIKWYHIDDSVTPNYSGKNKWVVDTLVGMPQRGNIAFISNNGKTNTYSIGNWTFAHIVTDSFYITPAEEFMLTFDWKAVGEMSTTSTPTDYLRVFIFNPNKTITADRLPSTATADAIFTGLSNNSWKTETFILPDTLSGKAKKLVFTWVNNNSVGTQPPAAIDNIVFKGLSCGTPKDLQVTNYPDDKSLLLSCATYPGDVTFNLMYRKTSAEAWNIQKGDTSGNSDMNALLLKNLSPKTSYEIKVQKRCSVDTSFWSASVFGTTGIAQTMSINEDFEDELIEGAVVANELQKNKWVIGSAVFQGDAALGKSIYISKNNMDNEYYGDTASVVHFYYDINFVQAETFRLSFDWKGIGQAADYMRVSLIDLDEIPQAGTLLPVGDRIFGKDFYGQRAWKHEELLFSNEYVGKVKRLVFTWKNGTGNKGVQPPVAIDNLKFEILTCNRPDIKIIGSNPSSISLMTNGLEGGNNFVVDYRKSGIEQWSHISVGSSDLQNKYFYSIPSLTSGTTYEIRVRHLCGADTSAFTSVITARTTQELAQLPFYENFENQNSSSKWNIVNGQSENKWTIDSALASTKTGQKSIYITTGTHGENRYNTQKTSTVHFYRDIHFSQGYAYDLSFDWKGGDADNFLLVYIADVDQMINVGKLVPGKGILDGPKYYGADQWKRDTIRIQGDQLVNNNQTLVFTWSNTGNGSAQPPIAIDNIKLTAVLCAEPNGLTFASFPENGAVELKFTSEANTNNFIANCYNKQEEKNTMQMVNSTNPTLTGLSPKSDYEIKINAICQGDDTSYWSAPLSVLMPQKLAELTFDEPFENSTFLSNWTFVNGPTNSRGNKWCFGSASHHPDLGGYALYIDSSRDGKTNVCTPIASVVHAYRDIDFSESNSDYILSFDWQSAGIKNEKEWATNYFIVSMIDLNKVPVYGVKSFSDTISRALFTEYGGWNKATITLPKGKYSGTKKRLVFTWVNQSDLQSLKQPPATIDNLKITLPACNTPTNFIAKTLTSDSIQLTWSCLKTDTNNYEIKYQYGNEPALTTSTKDTVIKLGNLKSNTVYNLTLINSCGGENNTTISLKTTTLQAPASSVNFVEYFDKTPSLSDWTFVNNDVNNWYTGSVIGIIDEPRAPTSAAYISNTAGEDNSYAYKGAALSNVTAVSHIYRDIQFGAENEAVIEFDWRSVGNGRDYLKVYLTDSNTAITKNTELSIRFDTIIVAPVRVPFLGSKATWQRAFLTVKGVKNVKKRLVFSWRSYEIVPSNPPAAIGNLTIIGIDCRVPMNLSLQSYPTASSAVLKWDSVSTTSLIRYRRANGSSAWDTVSSNRSTVTLTNLVGVNSLYEAQIQNNCGGKTIWAPIMSFATKQTPTTLPFDEDFENVGNRAVWTAVNGNATNAWYIGNSLAKSGTHSAYISSDKGNSCTYIGLNPEKTLVYFYRDIEIPTGNYKEFLLQFDWKGFGEYRGIPRDFMLVYWTDENFIPQAGKAISSSSMLTNSIFYMNKHDWKKETIVAHIDSIHTGVRRLIFAWQNDSINGYQPPIAIDNIHADVSNCISPKNIAIYNNQLSMDTAIICWKYYQEQDDFSLKYRKKGTENWIQNITSITDTFYILRGLDPNTVYETEITASCGGNNSFSIPYSFQTLQESFVIDSGVLFKESFETEANWKSWTTVNGEQVNAWFWGTNAKAADGVYAAYISDSNGLIHRYFGDGVSSCSHLYKTFTFPDAPEYLITFNWKGAGSPEDYLIVSSTTSIPIQGIPIGQTANISDALYRNSDNGWIPSSASIRENLKGKTRNIVFSWINDASETHQPPAAIDNIQIKQLDCRTPEDLKLVSYPDLHSVGLKWTSATGDTFTIAYKKELTNNWLYKGVRNKTTDTLTGLDSNSVYEIMVQNNCPRGKENNWMDILWSSTLKIHTPNTPIELNTLETFDAPDVLSKWNIVNHPNRNQWYVNDLSGKEGNTIYISDDNGVSNHYTNIDGVYSVSHFYRDVHFPSSGNLELSFDWKSNGDATNGVLLVGLFDVTTELLPGDSIATTKYQYKYSGSNVWKTTQQMLPASFQGQQKRLIFTWKNTGLGATLQNPASVDNITVKAYTCNSDSIFRLKSLSESEIGLTWKKSGTAIKHLIEWRKYGTATSWNNVTVEGSDTTYILSNLTPSSYYEVKLTLQCAEGIGKAVMDSMKTAYPMPFFEDFSALTTTPIDWNRKQVLLETSKAVSLPAAEYTYNIIFGKTFVNAAGTSYAAKFFTSNNTRKDWLVTPYIDLGSSKKTQLEFKLGLSKLNTPEGVPDMNGTDDKFIVLMTDTSTWSYSNALVVWDNKLTNMDLNAISNTAEGTKIRIPLDGYTGSKRFAFYFESTIANSSNELFVDSVFIRPFVCEDVEDLKAVYINYDNATVQWTKKDAEQYKWEVRYGAAFSPSGMPDHVVLNENELKLTPLDTNQIYNVFVRSVCENTIRSNWQSVNFSTLALCNNMSEDSIVTTPSDITATITWGANTGINKSWELCYGSNVATLDQMQKIYVSSPSYTITGLVEETEYAYYLRAVCIENDNISNWTTRKTFKTRRTPCPTVSNVTVSNVRTNSATVSWDAPVEQNQWEVRYGSSGAAYDAMIFKLTTDKTITLTALNANTTYDVVVRAICRPNDSSDWSARKQITTISCGTVTNLAVVKNPNGASATLSWTVPNPDQIEWQIGIDTNTDFSTAKTKMTILNPYTIQYAEWMNIGMDTTKNNYIAIKAMCGTTLVDTWSDYVVLASSKQGIEALENTQISISLTPNPAKDFSKLSIGGAEGQIEVQIYTITGSLVMSEKLNCTPQNIKELSIKGLQHGAYTVRIVHEKWTRTEKLIVQ